MYEVSEMSLCVDLSCYPQMCADGTLSTCRPDGTATYKLRITTSPINHHQRYSTHVWTPRPQSLPTDV